MRTKVKIFLLFLCSYQKKPYLCSAFQNDGGFRAFSSAGSEHLPYKQRVGGSNPSTPTKKRNLKHHHKEKNRSHEFRAFSSAGSEHLPYKQRVGGSNPSTPTQKSTFRWTIFFADISAILRRQTKSRNSPFKHSTKPIFRKKRHHSLPYRQEVVTLSQIW